MIKRNQLISLNEKDGLIDLDLHKHFPIKQASPTRRPLTFWGDDVTGVTGVTGVTEVTVDGTANGHLTKVTQN